VKNYVEGPLVAWVIAGASLKKSQQREGRWNEVWRSWWSKAIPNDAVTEKVLQVSWCSQYGW